MVRVPTHRAPIHAGEILLEEFLNPMELSQRELAVAIHVPYQRVNELVNGRRGVTPSTALRLSKFFGTTPGFWMNLQLRWDLYHAQRSEAAELKKIRRRRSRNQAAPKKSTVQ
jgi:addiction module HigA family antidote